MASSVGQLFVEIVSKGFQKVQADAEAVKKSLQNVDPAIKGLQDKLGQQPPAVFAKLGSEIDALRAKAAQPIALNIPTPAVAPLNVPAAVGGLKTPELPNVKPVAVPVLAEGLDKVQQQIEALKPHAVALPVVAEGLAKVQADLTALKGPNVTIPALLTGLEAAQRQLDGLKPHAFALPVLAEGIAKAQQQIDTLKGHTVSVPVQAEGTAKAQAEIDGLKGHTVNVPVKTEEVKPPAATPVTVPVKYQPKGVGEALKAFAGRTIRLPIEAVKGKFTLGTLMKDFTTQFNNSLAKAGTSLQDLGTKIQAVGQTAGGIFTRATAGILGFVAMASPAEFDKLQIAIAKCAIQIGRFFLPLLRDVTGWFDKAYVFLKGLTDETRESVLHWTKVGLAFTGVLAVLPRIIGLVSGVVSVFTMLGTAFSALWAVSPVGLLVLLVGALSGFREGESALDGVINAFNTLKEIVTPIVDLVLSIGQAFLSFIGPVVDALGGMIPVLQAVVSFLVIYKAAALLGAVATGTLGTAMTGAAGAVTALKTALLSLMANPVALVIAAIATSVMALSGSFSKAKNNLDALIRSTDKLQSVKDKLEAGGTVTQHDIRQLSSGVQQRLEQTKNDPAARKKYLDEEIARQDEIAKGRMSEEQRIRMQQAIEASKGVEKDWFTGKRTDKQIEMLEQARGQKFDAETRENIRAQYNKVKKPEDIDIQAILRAMELRGEEAAHTADILKALREGKVDKKDDKKKDEKGKDSDRFRGEARPQKPELVAIQDYYTKLLTAQQNDKNAIIQQEILDQSKTQTEIQKDTNKDLKDIKNKAGNNDPFGK